MLLKRCVLVIDAIVLTIVVGLLIVAPAERCARFEMDVDSVFSDDVCSQHPAQHLPVEFFKNFQISNAPLSNDIVVCHKLEWSHYAFWKNMYIVVVPAFCCFLMILIIFGELLELDTFHGRIQATSIVFFTFISMVYIVSVLHFETHRIQRDWPIAHNAQFFGFKTLPFMAPPPSWKYSILLCLASAFLKIARILIQHFLGDKKLIFEKMFKRKCGEGNLNEAGESSL